MIIAILLIAGAIGIGWYIGRRTGPTLAAQLTRLTGKNFIGSPTSTMGMVQYATIALLLLVVGQSISLRPLANIALALALSLAVGLLVMTLLRAMRLNRGTAGFVSIGISLACVAGTLGGMQPLMTGLDDIGFTIGSHRLSLLALLNALVVVVVLYLLARAANQVVSHLIGRASALDLSQRVLAQKLAGIGVIAAAVLLGVDMLGIDLTALTVFSGAAGLAVGFGLQKTFGNLIAGLILLMDRSVKPGDVIVVGDTFGAISKIGVRAVSVVTRDGKEHLIPNEQLMTEAVENWSYSSRNVRVHIPVGVAYSSDLALAQRLMIEAASNAARVLADPKPSVWLKGFGDSSVDHEILFWISDPEDGVGNVRSDILNRVWVLFGDNGIEIPFPQRDVHIRTSPSTSCPTQAEHPEEDVQ
ncbi:mechanosensitive ion channel family protein [Caulobacter sp. NIBR2454]|nr:mechanosensitive ion channel domain-containing protein [Caulobacter sp. NIBR2454]